MSHKLQLHLLLDHISAKITANAAIGLCSLAEHFSCPIRPLCPGTRGSGGRKRFTPFVPQRRGSQTCPFPGPSFHISNLQRRRWSAVGRVWAEPGRTAGRGSLGPRHFWWETRNDS